MYVSLVCRVSFPRFFCLNHFTFLFQFQFYFCVKFDFDKFHCYNNGNSFIYSPLIPYNGILTFFSLRSVEKNRKTEKSILIYFISLFNILFKRYAIPSDLFCCKKICSLSAFLLENYLNILIILCQKKKIFFALQGIDFVSHFAFFH